MRREGGVCTGAIWGEEGEYIGDIRLLDNRGEGGTYTGGGRGSDMEIYGWEVAEVYQHNSLIRGTQTL